MRGRTTGVVRPSFFARYAFARFLARTCALVCTLCAPLPVLAQARTVPVELQLEEVLVRASRVTGDSSLSRVTVLPGQSSDALPLLPSDLLRGIPGAFVQQTTPGQGIPIVRGLKGSQVLHLVDGFRINNAFFRSAPNQYLALVPVEAVASIEVDRGPVGTLYGSDAMGGVVHLQTRQPLFDQAGQWGGRVGWIGNARGVSGALQGRVGSSRHAVDAGISWSDIGDRRVGGGTRIAPSAYETRSAWLRTRHRGPGGEWGFTAQVAEQPATPRVDELIPGFGQLQPAASEFVFEPNRRDFLMLSAAPAVDSAWAEAVQLQVGWQRIVDDRRVRELGSSERTLEKNSSELLGISLLATRALSSVHRLRYGVDMSTDDVRSSRYREHVASGDRKAEAARFPDGSRMDSLGIFVDYLWDFGPRSSVEAGLRYSRFHIDIAATAFGGEAVELDPNDISARLGLRHSLSPGLTFTANVAQGFRAPNVFDLSALGPRPGNRFNVANTGLSPERILSIDGGLQAQVGTARIDGTLFYSDYSDRITSVLTGDVTDDGRLVVSSDNVGESHSYGGSLTASWVTGAGLALDGTLNWTWGEDRMAGATAPSDRIPPLNGRLRFTMPLERWDLESVVLFAGSQERLSPRDRRDPRIDPRGTGGWLAVNLRARRQLAERLMLTVGVENIFDRRYREHGSGIDAPGRGVVVELAVPLDG